MAAKSGKAFDDDLASILPAIASLYNFNLAHLETSNIINIVVISFRDDIW